MRTTWWAARASFGVFGAGQAFAADCASCAAPSAREIQSAVDSYLAPTTADSTLVGGPGSAGYDGGFWIRGGSFLMKINLTIQTRWEGFDWDDKQWEPRPGGDLSGFSLPRVTLKFSGDATCDVHYYAELEFGHAGTVCDNENNAFGSITEEIGNTNCLEQLTFPGPIPLGGKGRFSDREFGGGDDYGVAREAWIEYETSPALVFRMGLIKTAA